MKPERKAGNAKLSGECRPLDGLVEYQGRKVNMRNKLTGMLAGIAMTLASGTAAYSQELTIFWAEWDPANYLQELVNEYEAETGVKVTVETTPWSDFQT